MVNLKYVEKRKRNKIVTIASLAGAVVVLCFGIVSFLGQRTGSFTVSLKTSNVKLALSSTGDFEDSTTYLRIENLDAYELNCFQNFKDPVTEKVDFSLIDDPAYNIDVTGRKDFIGARVDEESGDVVALDYFKYTFFVKNIGATPAHYDMNVNIISDSRDGETSKQISSFLRACIIEDSDYENYTVYARRSNDATHYDTNPSETSTLEYLDCSHERDDKYEGLAEPFVSSSKICKRVTKNFVQEQVKRYTMLFWLEGDDAEAFGIAPKDCKLKLGVEIQAYEN